ncbi:MAG: hypothetical protein EWM50_05500 [Gottschalkiaceae bacterium]|nr:MAG: hypothetical protein EWM50_05500 [Gottschalkiaceae bacterium]
MEIKYSKDVKENIIQEILDIESAVYDKKYRGTYESIQARYNKNKDTFILAYDNNKMIGYLCFLPITDILYDEIISANRFHDDNISAENITNFYDKVNLYLISIAIIPAYQDTDVIKEMTYAFFTLLNDMRERNICINNIIASAVTNDGEKYLIRLGFKQLKSIHDEYTIYHINYKKEHKNYDHYLR